MLQCGTEKLISENLHFMKWNFQFWAFPKHTRPHSNTLHGEHKINCSRFSFTHSYNVVIGKHLNEYFPLSAEGRQKFNKNIFTICSRSLSLYRDRDVSMARIFHTFSAHLSSVDWVILLEIIRKLKCFYQKPWCFIGPISLDLGECVEIKILI